MDDLPQIDEMTMPWKCRLIKTKSTLLPSFISILEQRRGSDLHNIQVELNFSVPRKKKGREKDGVFRRPVGRKKEMIISLQDMVACGRLTVETSFRE